MGPSQQWSFVVEVCRSCSVRLGFFGLMIFSLIMIPLVFFGDAIEQWTLACLRSAAERPGAVAVTLSSLLAADVFLPVPSSLVSTAAGAVFGWWHGMWVSAVGMTLSSGIGYLAGGRAGRPAAARLFDPQDLKRLEQLGERYGDWVIMLVRPVPVLAEASTFLAGISRMSFGRFMGLSILAYLGISLVYAQIGAYAAHLYV